MAMLSIALTMMLQGAVVDGQRQSFMQCLSASTSAAISEKVQLDAFDAWVRGKCGDKASLLKASLVKFDTSHGVGRKQAESDDQQMIDDFYKTAAERYQSRSGLLKPAPATVAASTPAPSKAAEQAAIVPASAPAERPAAPK